MVKKNWHGVNENLVKDYKERGKKVGERFWPHHAYREFVAAIFTVGAIVLVSAFLPGDPVLHIGPPTPQTPEILPDWFLMWVYGPLKVFDFVNLEFIWGELTQPFIMGIVFPTVFFGALAAIPFVDRFPESRHPLTDMYERPKKNATGFAILSFLVFALFAGLLNMEMYGIHFAAETWRPLFIGLMFGGPVVVWLISFGILKILGPIRMKGGY